VILRVNRTRSLTTSLPDEGRELGRRHSDDSRILAKAQAKEKLEGYDL
jgi:hypothetical protein